MSEQPTPRPWFLHDFTGAVMPPNTPSNEDVTISCDDPATITVAFMGRALTAGLDEARANAGLIVRAVNAHDELVAALQKLLQTPMNDGARRMAEAALAKAEVQPRVIVAGLNRATRMRTT